MNATMEMLEIRKVEFSSDNKMLITMSNDRTLIIPLDHFKEIAALSAKDRSNYEVIDGENLSFLAIDEIYNIHELIGL